MPKKDIDMALIVKLIDDGYTSTRLADKLNISIRCIKARLDKDYPAARIKLKENGTINHGGARPSGGGWLRRP